MLSAPRENSVRVNTAIKFDYHYSTVLVPKSPKNKLFFVLFTLTKAGTPRIPWETLEELRLFNLHRQNRPEIELAGISLDFAKTSPEL